VNRNGHLGGALLTASAVSWQLDQPLWQRALSPIVALATAMAPDVDNTRWWQQIRKRIPIKIVRQALRHRGLTHSWLVPLLMYKSQDDPSWVFIALIAGYASHILCDALFGDGGVPVLLWYWYLGIQLPMGKRLEDAATVTATVYGSMIIFLGPVIPVRVPILAVGLVFGQVPW
jgi:membrane-bound metal-dependent hydrolase YbcI (DUF457 family)